MAQDHTDATEVGTGAPPGAPFADDGHDVRHQRAEAQGTSPSSVPGWLREVMGRFWEAQRLAALEEGGWLPVWPRGGAEDRT